MAHDTPADLEDRLEHYARTISSQRLSARKSWALYSAASGAALIASPAAEAAIVYSGLRNLSVSASVPGTGTDIGVLVLDLNSDAQPDFRMRADAVHTYFPIGTITTEVLSFFARAYSDNAGNRLVGSWATLSRLSAGSPVNSSQAFLWNGRIFGTIFSNFVPLQFDETDQSGYLGVHFAIGGNMHYGWIHVDTGMTAPASGFLTVIDWAYEDTPNTPITAGQTVVPEPSPLALLALGSAGLAFYRRHRTRQG